MKYSSNQSVISAFDLSIILFTFTLRNDFKIIGLRKFECYSWCYQFIEITKRKIGITPMIYVVVLF